MSNQHTNNLNELHNHVPPPQYANDVNNQSTTQPIGVSSIHQQNNINIPAASDLNQQNRDIPHSHLGDYIREVANKASSGEYGSPVQRAYQHDIQHQHTKQS